MVAEKCIRRYVAEDKWWSHRTGVDSAFTIQPDVFFVYIIYINIHYVLDYTCSVLFALKLPLWIGEWTYHEYWISPHFWLIVKSFTSWLWIADAPDLMILSPRPMALEPPGWSGRSSCPTRRDWNCRAPSASPRFGKKSLATLRFFRQKFAIEHGPFLVIPIKYLLKLVIFAMWIYQRVTWSVRWPRLVAASELHQVFSRR